MGFLMPRINLRTAAIVTDNCYYRIQPKKKAVSECDDCPYGRASPCIGWCTKHILEEMGLAPSRKRCGDGA